MTRQFTHEPARRCAVPLLVSLIGPSGSGKTFSALRLASGIKRVVGGDIFVLDTEHLRATHYADDFNFQHVPFDAPFSPLDYRSALHHCVSSGAKTIVIDSMSHEHDGDGGVLEMHDAILNRMAGTDWKKRQRCSFTAWAEPKAARRKLINALLQLGCNVILCFRAKEKLRPVKGGEPEKLGWMANGADEFNYEATVRFLLQPGCNGVPELHPMLPGEKETVKIPRQFTELFSNPEQLNESYGEAMARWAAGDDAAAGPGAEFTRLLAALADASSEADLDALKPDILKAKRQMSKVELDKLIAAGKQRREELARPADGDPGSLGEHLGNRAPGQEG